MKLIFSLLLSFLAVTANAQFTDAQKAYLARDNRLLNSGFEEGVASKFYTTSGSGITITSESTITRNGSKKALKIALSSSTNGKFFRTFTAGTYDNVQMQAGSFIYTTPSTTGVSICTVSGSVETSDCYSLIGSSSYKPIFIPVVSGSSGTTGYVIKVTSGTVTADVYLDDDYTGAIPEQTVLACANPTSCSISFQARINGNSETTSSESVDWINTIVRNSAGNYTINFNSGIFTQTPVCIYTNTDGGNFSVDNGGKSSTAWTYRTYNASTGASLDNVSVDITCYKTGTDLQNALNLSGVVVTNNQNYGPTAYTPTLTGFGSATAINFTHSRDGSYLVIDGTFTSGTPTVTEARISLPSGLTTSSNYPTLQYLTPYANSDISSVYGGSILVEPSVTYLTMGYKTSGDNILSKKNANSIVVNGDTISFSARIKIQGWETPDPIWGNFIGIPKINGSDKAVKYFYATTGYGANCTTATCTLAINDGLVVSSVTRSGSGTYKANLTGCSTSARVTGLVSGSSASNVRITGLVDNDEINFTTEVSTTQTPTDGDFFLSGYCY